MPEQMCSSALDNAPRDAGSAVSLKRQGRVRNLFGFAALLAAAFASPTDAHDFTLTRDHRKAVDGRMSTYTLVQATKSPAQTSVVRTTGGVDTTGWVLIAILHGPDAAWVREGQQVRAFSVYSRTRMHLARVTRVIKLQNGVRVEATLEARVLGLPIRYLMEIVIGSI
jgi:hypothetical protein